MNVPTQKVYLAASDRSMNPESQVELTGVSGVNPEY